MDQQAKIATTPPDDRPQPPARRPYEPPHAEFVPLRVEERLMACSKNVPMTMPPGGFPEGCLVMSAS